MKGLEKRLVYLFTGEFFAVVVFTFVYIFYSVNPSNSYSLLYVFFILNFILLQGSFYWFIKWKRLKIKENILPNLNKLLSILKKINLTLLYVAPVIFLIDIIQMAQVPFSQFFLTVFIYAFAIIEYINYYHIQLTNFKNGRGKKSSIAKELNKIK
ncbi:general stress protein [Bacillus norwichensis]|uniref:General stress protein n=1 Tax=Bacillus norwichensis TaxID=2762217 RepID=A0ABR8VK05_9BACI|nr:general stress protein [Bacillus norwichensis]MBD8005047.1 general stress protein [Bacillus norwichensis]